MFKNRFPLKENYVIVWSKVSSTYKLKRLLLRVIKISLCNSILGLFLKIMSVNCYCIVIETTRWQLLLSIIKCKCQFCLLAFFFYISMSVKRNRFYLYPLFMFINIFSISELVFLFISHMITNRNPLNIQ